MNGKQAKRLRRMAREEVAGDKSMSDPRELVIARINGHDRVINNPHTEHFFAMKLKSAYNKSKRGQQTH